MTEWNRLVRYWCISCSEECINHMDSGPARAEECQRCFELSDLDLLDDASGRGASRELTPALRQGRSTGPLPWGTGGDGFDGRPSE